MVRFIPQHSLSAGKLPTLSLGEVATQLADRKLFVQGVSEILTFIALASNGKLPPEYLPAMGITVEVGTTEQRPTTPTVGYTRYNTTDSCLEYYSGTDWHQDLRLADGSRAIRTTNGLLISESRSSFVFGQASNGIKNVYLQTAIAIASNTNGIVLPRNAALRSLCVSFSAATTSAVTIRIRKNKSATIAQYVLAVGTTKANLDDLEDQFNAGDEIAIYLASSANVAHPLVITEFAWRD